MVIPQKSLISESYNPNWEVCNTGEQSITHICILACAALPPRRSRLYTIYMNESTASLLRKKLYQFIRLNSRSDFPRITFRRSPTFLVALAHEVRNPLSTIDLAAEMLKEDNPYNERQELLDMIRKASRRIKELINSLLAPAPVEIINAELCPPQQLLADALAITQDRIRLKNISVSQEYVEVDCSVLVDKEKMKIALANIIMNAIDAMPSAGGLLRLITQSTPEGIIIEIRDNGVGISQEHLGNIFKPYFTNKIDGMGLGLSLTLDILKQNHARLDLRSKEGEGTRFLLLFDRPKNTV